MGKITKTGNKHLRYEKDSNITRFYHKIAKKKRGAKATVAAASKMLRKLQKVNKK